MLTLHDGDFGKNSTPQLLRPKCKRGDCPLISFRMRNQGWIKMLDIFMLAMLTGKERTRREFEDLLAASGFRLDRVIDVGLSTSILDASVI